ncbi:MAG: transglycosylase domain-containing protein [Candidatus Yanofskybacteria bacterium]|nr:transglycosylase domain-containing protein [Candidatus Yanofskybacteria bacterium]
MSTKTALIFGKLKPWAVLLLWGSVIGAILTFSYLIYLQSTLPDPESIVVRRVKESTKIYDKTGEVLLYDIYDEEKRTIIPWQQIPESIRKATIAAEDSNFYNHNGFDFKGIVRAFIKNLQTGSISQGGSTITQQLVKKALLGDQRTISRKLREVMLAIEIERRFSKDEILWMYLNQIPYGSNAYGVESATQTYYGKPASELTLAESAILAAVINAPSRLSPYGTHVEELVGRKNFVLQRMLELGFVNQAEYDQAVNETVAFKTRTTAITAPHFVIMAKEYLAEKYGEEMVESGGFKITTTLDAELQESAEELVTRYADINARSYKATNAALVAIDPRTGDVLALVGSRDYFDIEGEGNFNVALSPNRQPGSSFKPFAYAQAFEKGYTDSTIIFDLRTEFNPLCAPTSLQTKDRFGSDCYHPQNYDSRYRGPVTMRQALQQSLNVPAVQTLYLADLKDTIDLAKKMGITTLDRTPDVGLSLVLGGAEVRLVDMVSAYGVFANDGVRNPWTFIKKIELADGTIVDEQQHNPTRVLDSQVARLVSSILSDNAARAPVFGFNSPLAISGRDVAAKTGTTQNNRDAWVLGYTPSVTVGVWTGNNNNTPMTAAGAGISASGPLWNAFMRKALETTPREYFPQPDPDESSKIMLNGSYVSPQGIHAILHYVKRDDPRGEYPANPEQDPQYRNWEWVVQRAFPNIPVQPEPNPSPSPTNTPDITPLTPPEENTIIFGESPGLLQFPAD